MNLPWKKKSDVKVVRSMTFHASWELEVDSSCSDDELPEYLVDKIREYFSADKLRIVVKSVTRDGDGVVGSLAVDFCKD